MRGIRVCQNNPCINHLYFADVTFLFIRNKKDDVELVRSILDEFKIVSGQKVNLAKSSLFFGANTSRE